MGNPGKYCGGVHRRPLHIYQLLLKKRAGDANSSADKMRQQIYLCMYKYREKREDEEKTAHVRKNRSDTCKTDNRKVNVQSRVSNERSCSTASTHQQEIHEVSYPTRDQHTLAHQPLTPNRKLNRRKKRNPNPYHRYLDETKKRGNTFRLQVTTDTSIKAI